MFWPKGRVGSWLAVAALGIAAQAILWSVSEPSDLFSDFYKAYFPAGDRLWNEGAVATWETSESAAVGFVNLPILAWLFVPLALFGEPAAGWAFLALGIAAIATTYALLLRLGDFNIATSAMLALSILASGPLVNSLREGNTTHFVLLLLVVALLLWRAGKEYAAGLVLGLCALFKLPLMLIGLYVLLRGRWRVVAGGASAIVGAGLLSLAVFGLEINIGWYQNCIVPFVGGVMPAFNVQSIDGFLARLESGPALLMEWTPLAASLWHKIVRGIVLSGMFIVAFVAMIRGDRSAAGARPFERDTLEFSIVLDARGRHQPGVVVALLPVAAVALGALSRRPARPPRRRSDALADGRRHAARLAAGGRVAARLRHRRCHRVADDRVGLDVRRPHDPGSIDPRRVVCWPIERRGKAAGERALSARQGAHRESSIMSETPAMSQTSPSTCPSSVSLTRGLAIFLLLNALVLNGLIWLASSGPLQGDRAAAQRRRAAPQRQRRFLGRDGDRARLLPRGRSAADLQRGLLRPQRQVPVSAVLAVRPDGDAGDGAAAARAHHRSGHLRLADRQRHHRVGCSCC